MKVIGFCSVDWWVSGFRSALKRVDLLKQRLLDWIERKFYRIKTACESLILKLFQRNRKEFNTAVLEFALKCSREGRLQLFNGTYDALNKALSTGDIVYIIAMGRYDETRRSDLEQWFFNYTEGGMDEKKQSRPDQA